jgi:ATP-dependent DNA helicase RecG
LVKSYEEKGLSYEEALKAKRAIRNGQLTLAGLLFFGKDPQSVKPSFTIKAVSYFGNNIESNRIQKQADRFKRNYTGACLKRQ